MKFTDIVKRQGLTGPIQKADRPDGHPEGRARDFEIHAAPLAGSTNDPDIDYKYGRPFAVRDEGERDPEYYRGPLPDKDFNRFQDRLRMGKVKLCDGCGGVMAKSSRMILSPLAGFVVILLGAVLMTLYGLATNFYQPPWFVKFVSRPAITWVRYFSESGFCFSSSGKKFGPATGVRKSGKGNCGQLFG